MGKETWGKEKKSSFFSYPRKQGIETRSPGYKQLLIQPHITDKLNYVKASFDSPYGTVSSGWERKNGKIIVQVTIPVNTTANILLDEDTPSKIYEEGTVVTENRKFLSVDSKNGYTSITAGSGEYLFEYAE